MNRTATMQFLKKGWPFIAPLILFGLPPFASKGYALLQMGSVNWYILTHSIKRAFQPLDPVFKILPLLLALALFLFGNKMAKAFALFAAVSYFLFGLLQGISLSADYGWGISSAHLALSALIAVFWLREARSPQNDYSRRRQPAGNYWVVVPALIAFWEPAHPVTGLPDFNPAFLLTSGGGLAFCMMTPFYLAVLLLIRPKSNPTILALTSVAGVLYALGNMGANFFLNSGRYWWIGALHLPLLVLSAVGLIASFRDAFSRPGSPSAGMTS